ncbi:bifunctional methylenetetrahydrofolate dehydrogenase/methenyltetrahydrofolate cyclohydrolase FolD [Halomonas sp. 18H]|uniref:bifunctional methylenetetrahydrofolate dehydrogenase/methenyltetrahydrofolate cyclohydrolase FolD n=1 Tax=Halomonas almeriensis TaxID=308163 RepID=UPI00222EC812|nr:MULTISPECIES: bifunctional methylenetetrahydrofolate dehydrogenase/methenyltetrahydrofolate cyclohydrolase FolD [Halomonas]MCW4151206.1 bifunctional methylenetetrahydrofolate dehydrogenase/methenyltetrahydrofolate cyclohydrolase FolD [Halomonas sp. 18H]MDN3553086.1 bifunctional methylenetetrahydrofolate dehydrogenase/methenyltetrahydrofolate cyclohydrolase FolD [Halomonas almeriensis]
MAQVIDGKELASQVLEDAATEVSWLKQQFDRVPGLAVVLVGDDAASQIYVRNKIKRAKEAGIASFEHYLGADTSQDTLDDLIQQLNDDPEVHGILVQLPLPKHIDEERIISSILPEKDVDGFHPANVGALSQGRASLVPCTPQGCLIMLRQVHEDLSGKNAVIVGRSNIVGKPMAALLLQENCTVTIAHSRTRDIRKVCQEADILIAATGSPGLIQSDWIKPDATVIDVGINAIEVDGQRKLTGDVDFAAASQVAGAISPVPGGVGPMTIACLLLNTTRAARAQLA